MQLGIVGLGRMGSGIAQRLLAAGHEVVAYDRSKEAVEAIAAVGAQAASSVAGLVSRLTPPRAVWLMVPSGDITEAAMNEVAEFLAPGDAIIDGGNSNYKDTVRRAAALRQRGIDMLDVGTSGGIWGLKEGYSLMVGGDREAFSRLKPIFMALAPGKDKGCGYVGPSGAGHFVKMVHNGVEYGMMQAYAEGFELLKAKKEFELDVAQVAEIWRYGSVVRSWLLDLTAAALQEDPELSDIAPYVEDSGEGRWTVQESVDLAVPAPVITLSLQARFRSRQDQPFGARVLAAMRQKFGGHAVKKVE